MLYVLIAKVRVKALLFKGSNDAPLLSLQASTNART